MVQYCARYVMLLKQLRFSIAAVPTRLCCLPRRWSAVSASGRWTRRVLWRASEADSQPMARNLVLRGVRASQTTSPSEMSSRTNIG